jgi:hypothetical protein
VTRCPLLRFVVWLLLCGPWMHRADPITMCSDCTKQLTIADVYFDTAYGKVKCQPCAGIELGA